MLLKFLKISRFQFKDQQSFKYEDAVYGLINRMVPGQLEGS